MSEHFEDTVFDKDEQQEVKVVRKTSWLGLVVAAIIGYAIGKASNTQRYIITDHVTF